MFGRYEMGFSYADPDIRIQLTDNDGLIRYERDCAGKKESRYLGRTFSAIHIHPVEPVNLPETLTRFLEISFPPLIVSPGAEQTIYLKFPVEIAVFLESGEKMDPLDVFSLVPVKFSLYGSPSEGVITRYYQSDLSTTIPVTDPHREGVMCLCVKNSGTETMTVSRAVFDSNSMCLFYGDRVAMTATMEILSPIIAHTTFSETAPADCPNRAIDLYLARGFSITRGKGYFMGAGML
ncbi:MAG: DUF432 domain-containing protein [Methanoregula sp.]|nr:DUF432 domain-containing protein [Methanoregula sp.]